ncbi:MAG: glycosyltransferase family 4 protein [Anaerolineaceae bacterium]|nr:glycosyltransferase family 4 protein [Anaerolineaceae bacterium]
MVTFRDTRLLEDWWTELTLPSLNYAQVLMNWLYEDNLLVARAVRSADALFGASRVVSERAKRHYHLRQTPEFLPTPVEMPQTIHKADQPTVCMLARWDRRKRPELFFDLASKFPEVTFLAPGESRDKRWDRELRQRYGNIPNLKMMGFVNQFESNHLNQILGQSWVLVNTAAREGLPNSFIEACAHRCAILSHVDPDGFASRFGKHAPSNQFEPHLRELLSDGAWKERGEQGYQYVKQVFDVRKAIDQHLQIYSDLLQ